MNGIIDRLQSCLESSDPRSPDIAWATYSMVLSPSRMYSENNLYVHEKFKYLDFSSNYSANSTTKWCRVSTDNDGVRVGVNGEDHFVANNQSHYFDIEKYSVGSNLSQSQSHSLYYNLSRSNNFMNNTVSDIIPNMSNIQNTMTDAPSISIIVIVSVSLFLLLIYSFSLKYIIRICSRPQSLGYTSIDV